ncbi:MAG: PLD nuclease N-terminal domain-containing protein [Gemmatimonadota bacterium]|nr:PLD nuclease N-terminal domain-containing protein [Gemmatimonadota bacterium]
MMTFDPVLALDTRWVLAVLLLAIDIWSIGLIIRAKAARRETLLWIGVVLLVPVFGCIFWYALGPKPATRG